VLRRTRRAAASPHSATARRDYKSAYASPLLPATPGSHRIAGRFHRGRFEAGCTPPPAPGILNDCHVLLRPLFALICLAPLAANVPSPADAAEPVIARMMEVDRTVTPQLRHYTSSRRYSLENKRFGQRAEMTVRMTFRHPGHKQFEVVSEKGSGAIRSRVFRKMLESEIEASSAEMRDATHITPRNYSFRLIGSEELEGRQAFVLEAIPKTKNKFLFRGKIWVDAEDYAIARIEGSPAQNPSFWVRKTTFVHRYAKFGPFWLAVSNASTTDVLVFGRTEVLVEYFDYRINEAPAAAGGNSPAPDK